MDPRERTSPLATINLTSPQLGAAQEQPGILDQLGGESTEGASSLFSLEQPSVLGQLGVAPELAANKAPVSESNTLYGDAKAETVIGEFGAGLQSGARQIASTPIALGGLMADAIGFDETGARWVEWSRQIAEGGAKRGVAKLEDLSWDPMTWARYVAGTIGEAVPFVLSVVGGAGAGNTLANLLARKGVDSITRQAILSTAPKVATSSGAQWGAFGTAAAIETGATSQELFSATKDVKPFASVVAGSAKGALELVFPMLLSKQFGMNIASANGLYDRFLDSVVKTESTRLGRAALGLGTEAVTEGLQEEIDIQARNYFDQNYSPTSYDAWSRRANSFVAGGIGGGIFSAMSPSEARTALQDKAVLDATGDLPSLLGSVGDEIPTSGPEHILKSSSNGLDATAGLAHGALLDQVLSEIDLRQRGLFAAAIPGKDTSFGTQDQANNDHALYQGTGFLRLDPSKVTRGDITAAVEDLPSSVNDGRVSFHNDSTLKEAAIQLASAVKTVLAAKNSPNTAEMENLLSRAEKEYRAAINLGARVEPLSDGQIILRDPTKLQSLVSSVDNVNPQLSQATLRATVNRPDGGQFFLMSTNGKSFEHGPGGKAIDLENIRPEDVTAFPTPELSRQVLSAPNISRQLQLGAARGVGIRFLDGTANPEGLLKEFTSFLSSMPVTKPFNQLPQEVVERFMKLVDKGLRLDVSPTTSSFAVLRQVREEELKSPVPGELGPEKIGLRISKQRASRTTEPKVSKHVNFPDKALADLFAAQLHGSEMQSVLVGKLKTSSVGTKQPSPLGNVLREIARNMRLKTDFVIQVAAPGSLGGKGVKYDNTEVKLTEKGKPQKRTVFYIDPWFYSRPTEGQKPLIKKAEKFFFANRDGSGVVLVSARQSQGKTKLLVEGTEKTLSDIAAEQGITLSPDNGLFAIGHVEKRGAPMTFQGFATKEEFEQSQKNALKAERMVPVTALTAADVMEWQAHYKKKAEQPRRKKGTPVVEETAEPPLPAPPTPPISRAGQLSQIFGTPDTKLTTDPEQLGQFWTDFSYEFGKVLIDYEYGSLSSGEQEQLHLAYNRERHAAASLSPETALSRVVAHPVLERALGSRGREAPLYNFEEWLAQNISRAMADLDTGIGPIKKFFKKVGRFITRAFETLARHYRAPSFIAFHSSPHDFNRFELEAMGTGEGAQAFGWGLYFAENRGVTAYYAKSIPYRHLLEKAKDAYSEWDSPQDALDELLASPDLTTREKQFLLALEKDDWLGFDYPHQAVKSILLETSNWENDVSKETLDAMKGLSIEYEVRIKANPQDFLQWDVRLGNQPIFQKLSNFTEVKADMLGSEFYKTLVANAKNDAASVSKMLFSFGIPGIRYLDQTSRKQNAGTSNTVIFDPSIVELIAKDGNLIEGAERNSLLSQAMSADPRKGRPHELVDTWVRRLMARGLEEAAFENSFLSETTRKATLESITKNREALKGWNMEAVVAHPERASTVQVRKLLDHLPEDAREDRKKVEALLALTDRHNTLMEWTLGIHQIADHNPNVEGLRNYVSLTRAMENDAVSWATMADERLRQAQQLPKDQQNSLWSLLIELDQMSYLDQVKLKKGEEKPRWPTGEELLSLVRKHKLTAETFEVYKSIRQDFLFFLSYFEQVGVRHAAETISDPEARAKKISQIEGEIAQLRQKPYFPHMRFGRFALTVKVKGKTAFFTTFDTEKQRQAAIPELVRQFNIPEKGKIIEDELSPILHQFVGLPKFALDNIKQTLGLDGEDLSPTQEKDRDLLEAMALAASPQESFRMRMVNRTNTAGFSRDGMRAYANYFAKAARHVARMDYSNRLQGAIKDVRLTASPISKDTRTRIADYMQRHYLEQMSPAPDYATVRALGFMWYFAFVPAAAFVNLTQLPLVTGPFLAGKFGDIAAGKAGTKAIGAAMGDYFAWMRGKAQEDTPLNEAISRAHEDRLIDDGFATELAAISQGSVLSRTMLGSKIARGVRMAAQWGTLPFQWAEKVNRAITFRAAWDLALNNPDSPHVVEVLRENAAEADQLRKERGWEERFISAYLVGADAVRRTQFEYSRWARPRLMEGGKGVIFMFKTYLLNMINFMFKSNRGVQARFLLAMLGTAGLMGLPGADDINEVVKWISRQLGYHIDPELFFRRFVKEYLDSDMADVLLHGASRVGFGIPQALQGLGLPAPSADLSGSLSMGRLIPGLAAGLNPESTGFNEVVGDLTREMAGPALGVPFALYQSLTDHSLPASDPKRWERVMPRAARDVSKAARYLAEGRERDRGGATIARFDPNDLSDQLDALSVGLGFQPTKLTRQWDFIAANKEVETYYKNERQLLVKELFRAVRLKDKEGKADAIEAIRHFNQDTPYKSLRITRDTLRRSIEARKEQLGMREKGIPTQKIFRPVRRDIEGLFPEVERKRVR